MITTIFQVYIPLYNLIIIFYCLLFVPIAADFHGICRWQYPKGKHVLARLLIESFKGWSLRPICHSHNLTNGYTWFICWWSCSWTRQVSSKMGSVNSWKWKDSLYPSGNGASLEWCGRLTWGPRDMCRIHGGHTRGRQGRYLRMIVLPSVDGVKGSLDAYHVLGPRVSLLLISIQLNQTGGNCWWNNEYLFRQNSITFNIPNLWSSKSVYHISPPISPPPTYRPPQISPPFPWHFYYSTYKPLRI